MPSRMLFVAPVLATVFVGPLRPDLQDSEGEPVVAVDENSTEDLSELSVSELLARMPADPWVRSSESRTLADVPEELRYRAESLLLSDDDWVAALTAADVIHTRPSWPAGEPFAAWIREPAWLRRTRITARAVDPALGTIAADNMNPPGCYHGHEGEMDRQRLLSFERLPAGTRHVDLEITIDQSDELERFSSEGEHRLWRGRLRLPVAAVSTFDEVLPALSDGSTASAIRRSLRASWCRAPEDDETRVLALSVGGAWDEYPELRGVAIALDVELRRNGVGVTRSRLVADDGAGWDDRSAGAKGWCLIEDTPEDLRAENTDLAGWDLLVTATFEDALTIWEADRWWKGSFEMPLSEAIETADAK